MEKIHLDLASRPLRNVRFFRLSLAVVIGFLSVLSVLTVLSWVRLGAREREAVATSKKLDGDRIRFLSEEKTYKKQASASARTDKKMIEAVNAVIVRKTFSWTGFLSDLEAALPERSFIQSLAPSFQDDGTLNLRLKVVSTDLDELLAFIDGLNARNFKKVRIIDESVDSKYQYVSEISLNYERISR